MIERVKCSTPDFAEQNVEKLLALFPECAGEKGTVDLDKLRGILTSKVVEGNVERYEFTWPGKRAAKAAASAATTKTLRPCREESVNFDETENLYIEGDNLEVLKLLQTSYAGKVKMIYIDPPYNTGHDFVYRDRFSLTDKELAEQGGAFDEDGNRFEVNDSAEARYHSNWCSMMYPRLKLARNLLREDGVLFMSIDDNEVSNLRRLADEIFGECNFVNQVIWKRNSSGKTVSKEFTVNIEYLLIYARSDEFLFNPVFKPLAESTVKMYSKDDGDGRGKYRLYPLQKPGAPGPETTYDYVDNDGKVWKCPAKGWRIKESKLRALENDGRLCKENGTLSEKAYWNERASTGRLADTYWDDLPENNAGTGAVSELFDGVALFSSPKPVAYLNRMLKAQTDAENADVVLDFFSGSATTAHAVMQLNAEDGGNRKFIMVQLPEVCAEGSEAAKAGYKNICEIGKERIRRAGKKIAENMSHGDTETRRREKAADSTDLFDTPDLRVSVPPCEKNIPDIGFRVLKLDSSSINDTSATVSETNQSFANFARIKEGRSSEDLLFQMLLETHIPLSENIVKGAVGGNEVWFVGVARAAQDVGPNPDAPLVACLDEKAKMTTEFFIEIAKLKPGVAFFRDDAFADDSARTNLQQAFDQFSPSTSIKVI